MAGIYDYPLMIEGDSVLGMTVNLKLTRVGVLKDLTNATVKMEVVRSKTSQVYKTLSSANANEILIQDIANCTVQILDFKAAELVDGDYHYRIWVEWLDGLTHTFMGGKFNIDRYPEEANPHKL